MRVAAGNTEAVFSSSEDRIRAGQATAAAAGLSIASCTLGAARSSAWALKVAEGFFAALLPSDCRICGAPLVKISRLPVCEECLDAMQPITGGVCTICGERLFSAYTLANPEGDFRCGLCRRVEPVFARAVAYGSYEGGLRELIHLLKFSGVRPAAKVLGRMLAEAIAALERAFPAEGVLVIPVPLHQRKRSERGFNQAELIARAALKLKPGILDRLRLCDGILEKKRETLSQIGLSSHQRRENLRGAFRVAKREAVTGREVLLIDDVYTTGATVSECARVLRRAGAAKVWVATVARTLKVSSQHLEVRPEGVGEEEAAWPVPLARAAGG